MRKGFIVAVIVSLLVVAVSLWIVLERGPAIERHQIGWAGGLVTEPIVYDGPRDGEAFRVWIDEGIVKYRFTGSDGRVLIEDGAPSASAYSRWHFFVDRKRCVWFYSGDIGTSVYVEQSSGYTRKPLSAQDPLAKEMPPEFYERLGATGQKEFGSR
jgi:hypothetical protein